MIEATHFEVGPGHSDRPLPISLRQWIGRHVCLTLVTVTLLMPLNWVNAIELNGRISSDFYGSERAGDTYLRSYVRFISTAMLWRGDRGQSVDLHTNLRWTGDLATDGTDVPQTYVYDLYVKLNRVAGSSTIYAGRQFVYNSLGSDLIDGLRTRFQVRKGLRFDLFGGATVSQQSPDEIRSLSKDNLIGGRVEYSPASTSKLGLNWIRRQSDGSASRHAVGMDGWKQIQRTEVYGRVSYDILGLDLAGAMARITTRPNRWYLAAEFNWRRPSIDGNTIFALIDVDAYKGVRLEVARSLTQSVRLFGQFHQELLQGSDVHRSAVGVRTGQFTIAWHHRDGYRGTSDGLRAQVSIRLRSDIEWYGSAFISRYKVQPETADKIDAHSSSAGLIWRPAKGMRFRVEGQYLNNAVDNGDFRIFLQAVKGFSLRSSERGNDR